MTTMPAAFLGHGESDEHPGARFAIPRPGPELRSVGPSTRAILASGRTRRQRGVPVTSSDSPRVIHDFYGFRRIFTDFDYPAPGSSDLV